MTFTAAAAIAMSVVACGASLNAVYEGDVRFERCMALDSRADVKPTLRRACWEEWLKFYTFGQTRDRIEYANLRAEQLRKASDFDEADWTPPSSRAPSAVPEPTSALAPPPMLMSADAGAEVDAGASPTDEKAPDPAPPAPPGADCADECQESWAFCKHECKSPACEKGCTGKYKQCMRRCF